MSALWTVCCWVQCVKWSTYCPHVAHNHDLTVPHPCLWMYSYSEEEMDVSGYFWTAGHVFTPVQAWYGPVYIIYTWGQTDLQKKQNSLWICMLNTLCFLNLSLLFVSVRLISASVLLRSSWTASDKKGNPFFFKKRGRLLLKIKLDSAWPRFYGWGVKSLTEFDDDGSRPVD